MTDEVEITTERLDAEKVDVENVDVVEPKQNKDDGGLVEHDKPQHNPNDSGTTSMRTQLLATLLVIVSAIAGGLAGIAMGNDRASEDLISWFALPGDLFIRSLSCVVLPLIFVNIIIAVIQMVDAGKVGKVGTYTVGLYLLTTLIASLEGVAAVIVFQGSFSTKEAEEDDLFFSLICPSTFLLAELDNGELRCVNGTELGDDDESTFFELDNVNDFFITSGDSFEAISFSETLQTGIFRKLIPDNIVGEFADGGFVGVVMFGIIFGLASQSLTRKPELLLSWLTDVNDVLVRIIEWIIYLTPIAVFSLIAGALASQEDLAQVFKDIGLLVVASLCVIVAHLTLVYPAMFFFFTRNNPYSYMRFLFPAQIFAFSCASSAATLPITRRCVTESKQVPDSIRDFVLPIGATINMDGTALYFPLALAFLAKTAGTELAFTDYVLLVIVSTIGSAGAAPVPNAGLVLIITGFNTVFGGEGVPDNFALIVAIDWLMDRFQTALNITGDCMVSRIVTHLAGLNIDFEYEGGPVTHAAADDEETAEADI